MSLKNLSTSLFLFQWEEEIFSLTGGGGWQVWGNGKWGWRMVRRKCGLLFLLGFRWPSVAKPPDNFVSIRPLLDQIILPPCNWPFFSLWPPKQFGFWFPALNTFRLLLIGRMRMVVCRWFCQWWWLWEWRWWWCSGMKCNKRQRWLVGNAALYKKREDSATDNSEEKKLNFQWICAQVVFQRRVEFSVRGKLKWT